MGVSAVDPCLNSCLQPKGVQSKSTQSEREDKQASHQKVEVDVRARLVVRLACVWLNVHTQNEVSRHSKHERAPTTQTQSVVDAPKPKSATTAKVALSCVKSAFAE